MPPGQRGPGLLVPSEPGRSEQPWCKTAIRVATRQGPLPRLLLPTQLVPVLPRSSAQVGSTNPACSRPSRVCSSAVRHVLCECVLPLGVCR